VVCCPRDKNKLGVHTNIYEDCHSCSLWIRCQEAWDEKHG
jgi:hypothetical protein